MSLITNTIFFKIYTFFKKRYRSIKRNKIVIKKINGIYYELQLNQEIDSNIYYNGYFEKYSTNAILKLVKTGMTVFDIGANVGCHTLPMAQLVGKTGRIVAFEPMEWPLKKLLRNINLNSFDNIRVEKTGLSDSSEIKTINFKSSWTIDNSKVVDADEPIAVNFTTLDEYIKNNSINTVDFIKIDVDGYEPKVLSGAIKCLTEYKPTLLMEFFENKKNLILFLTSLGYEFYAETSFKLLLDPINENKTNNLIVVHKSKSKSSEFLTFNI